jgi:hypothetical protein
MRGKQTSKKNDVEKKTNGDGTVFFFSMQNRFKIAVN